MLGIPLAPYIAAQVVRGLTGAVTAPHLTFGRPILSLSLHARTGGAQVFSEFIATFGLLSVIWDCSRVRANSVPFVGRVSYAKILTLAIMVALAIAAAPSAQAQTYQLIHDFSGSDGAHPSALVMDAAGHLYGATQNGGTGSACQGGCGVVFRLTHSGSGWVESPLYSFTGCSDGAVPSAGLTLGPDGSLYGTTQVGGSACGWAGNGTVYKLTPPASVCKTTLCPWIETVLYRFSGGSDGVYPANLIFDRAGNLYGATLDGGAYGNGLIYELTRTGNSWVKSTLYTFTGGADGGGPTGMLTFDQAGNLYGTTYYVSAVFELTPSGGSWVETVIYDFNGHNDGYEPVGVLFDNSGNLYGPTMFGGSFGGGIVYELTPDNGSWTETVLYNSTAPGGGGPETLVMNAAGNLFGTTGEGGGGFGSVFELTKENGGWEETDLHSFSFETGIYPDSNLVIDPNGNLLGTTMWGGNGNNCTPDDGCGVVWEITP